MNIGHECRNPMLYESIIFHLHHGVIGCGQDNCSATCIASESSCQTTNERSYKLVWSSLSASWDNMWCCDWFVEDRNVYEDALCIVQPIHYIFYLRRNPKDIVSPRMLACHGFWSASVGPNHRPMLETCVQTSWSDAVWGRHGFRLEF